MTFKAPESRESYFISNKRKCKEKKAKNKIYSKHLECAIKPIVNAEIR